MKQLLKILFKSILFIVIIIVVIILISFVNHKIKLKEESEKYKPTGKMVEVNNHKIHVYSEGGGDSTLVFMAGSGTSCPTLDFKTLYSKLSDKYRITVVEKAGYGFSETAKVSRDIDIVLEETRMALKAAGEKAPYVLMTHSMSALEAIYWAQKYPDEVKAIVGLDPAIPEVYESFETPSKITLELLYFGGTVGIARFLPFVCDSSAAIKDGDLTEEEKDLYRAIFYKSTMTKNMVDEIKEVKANAKKVMESGIPNKIPMYFFISNGKEVSVDNWGSLLSTYCNNLDNGKFMFLQCGHYVHNFESEVIAEETKKFIEDISK